MAGPDILTYDPDPAPPRFALPAGTADCHVHVFGPAARFPYAADRNFTPVDAPRERLFALHRLLGVRRCVVVQSMVHGLDNRVVEDTIAAGEGRYLGIALVPADVADAELARLAGAGMRGVRFHFMRHLGRGPGIADVLALTPRLRAHGLHLQVHFESSLVHELGPMLARSAVPVVIDHMGRVDATLGPGHADFSALFDLMQDPLFRVKVSGIDRIDSQPRADPDYAQGIALARILVEAYPDRVLWGTDWPHPNHTHVPRDATLVDALPAIAPTPALRQRLLVDNPLDFYRFPA